MFFRRKRERDQLFTALPAPRVLPGRGHSGRAQCGRRQNGPGGLPRQEQRQLATTLYKVD